MITQSEGILLSIAVAALTWAKFYRHRNRFVTAVASWSTFELIFWLWGKLRYSEVNQRIEAPLDFKRVELIKQRFLKLAGFMPIEDFLTGWFKGAAYHTILRGNVEEFIAYSLHCRNIDSLPENVRTTVFEYVCELEIAFNCEFGDGFNPDITFMAHLWEPLRSQPTPLLAQIAIEATAASVNVVLRILGFQKQVCKDLGYWIRQPKASQARQNSATCSITKRVHGHETADASASPQQRPLFFIHGVGIGLLPYLAFVCQVLKRSPQHPVILLDMPHVALRLAQRALDIDVLTEAIASILQCHGHSKACFVGHSFGSFCVSRICQLRPAIVHSIVLLDPVCCLTCYPKLLFNFLYRTYSLTEATSSFLGFASAARFIISRDLIIAETFCRQFLWHSLMLWPEDMPQLSVVSLSGNDDLVPAQLIKKHLEHAQSPATVLYHPSAGHGGFLLDIEYQRILVSHIQALLLHE